jgi:aspartate-semialdehyde dehydrogenase
MQGIDIAVVGATGAVGRELLSILASRHFPVGKLRLFSSRRSEGKAVVFNGQTVHCETLKPGCFTGTQIAFFDASDAVSKEWVPQAAEAGAWVVDNSATFRLDNDIPLIVPEVNGEILEQRVTTGGRSTRERIITGPNCSTVQMVVALKPIRDSWGLRRVVVSTYQSVSGAGSAAMDELRYQTAEVLSGGVAKPQALAHQIAFNCIPHIGGFKDDGLTSEERKMVDESRKLLGVSDLRINVECERPFELEDVRNAIRRQTGIILQDEPLKGLYPMSVTSAGRDAVYVGRIRRDTSVDNGLNLWVVSDNLRKGAALNAVQIGEVLVRSFG